MIFKQSVISRNERLIEILRNVLPPFWYLRYFNLDCFKVSAGNGSGKPVSYHSVWSAIRGQGMNFLSFVRKWGRRDKPEAKSSKSHNQK